jgi:hypothetical protein
MILPAETTVDRTVSGGSDILYSDRGQTVAVVVVKTAVYYDGH